MAKTHWAFGDLHANSTSHLGGDIVPWNWHVALLIRLNDGKLYILDPALSADPILKEVWYKLMQRTPTSTITGFVTCDSFTYQPSNSCSNPEKRPIDGLKCDAQIFLK